MLLPLSPGVYVAAGPLPDEEVEALIGEGRYWGLSAELELEIHRNLSD